MMTTRMTGSIRKERTPERKWQLGIVGLGKMGGSIALRARDEGIEVVGKSRPPMNPELEGAGVRVVASYEEFCALLSPPRVVFLSLPAGPEVDAAAGELLPHLDRGDVVLDGGNSFFMDSIRREREFREEGVHWLDCGTSGGVSGARNGACFMVGGSPEGIELAAPILEKLAVPGGFLHTGSPGSGHFVKLVHNGIEFGMLQAIGEGYELLKTSDFDLDLAAVFRNWSHGSVIRGWLVELMERGLRGGDVDGDVPDYVEDTGEVNWLVQYAINRETPVPVISQSVMELFASRRETSHAYKAIAVMRHGFGGHPYGPDGYIAGERKTSRIQKL
ncbi:MAG: phosphogluconate dehydrogenase (NAD(+)-dependent, decarboxylating) [Promethearchaeota archaeon]